jgi:probable F420-dependent oxidoreductase
MQFGVIFPQVEFPPDPVAVRDYAQAVEGMGFSHVTAYDHVLGANPDRPGGWTGPYTHLSSFLEPFVLFSTMAAHTVHLGLFTGVLVLPQRQAALVAKQAATLDLLSGGRLRLGVGIGWNAVEYGALGEDFHTRGRRIEEQIEVMRRLWAEPLVTFVGRWHRIEDAGIQPRPARAIPIWFGGHHDRVIRRIARLGDGWAVNYRTAADAAPPLEALDGYLAAAGRSRADVGLQVRVPYGDGDPQVWTARLAEWTAAGATHLDVNTMNAGLDTPAKHLEALRRFAQAVGVSPEV